jgi:hypothetical protein
LVRCSATLEKLSGSDSGTFIAKSWKAVLAQYKREKRRVDWAEVIKRAEEAVAA